MKFTKIFPLENNLLHSISIQPVLGQLTVDVKYGDYEGTLTLYVVEGKGPCLLGRDCNWLQYIRLDWANIRAVYLNKGQSKVNNLIQKYPEVFQEGLGTMRSFKAHLHLKEGVTPKFCRPRKVPFAIKESVGKELDRLEEAGIVIKENYSDWAAPIVPVPKEDGSIRVCGDFKVTINPGLNVDQYPLPKPSDLMTCLTGGKLFTKLDLTAAYQQMLLDEDSSKLVVINTQQGLYRYTRLPFGVASAPAVFQRAMDSILQGMSRVICYVSYEDDVRCSRGEEWVRCACDRWIHSKCIDEVIIDADGKERICSFCVICTMDS